jgi:hypothetical protein
MRIRTSGEKEIARQLEFLMAVALAVIVAAIVLSRP